MKHLAIVLLLVCLVGCTHNERCDSPVELSNQQDETTSGFLVRINENVSVDTEATRLLEKYSDLEVFSTFSSCNCFHANSGEETLQALQCEENVIFLEYNNAVGPN